MSTPNVIDELKAYKNLPVKDQSTILMQISELEAMRVSGNPPTQEIILECLTATGHLEIALACYGAQLTKQQWS